MARLTADQRRALDACDPRERAYAVEYVSNGGNGLRAAQAAGYGGDDRTLGVTATRLLKRARVAAAIDALRDPHEEKWARRLERLRERLYRMSSGTRRVKHQGQVLEEVIETKDQLKASELLGKMHGAFSAQVDVKHSGSVDLGKLPEAIRRKLPGGDASGEEPQGGEDGDEGE